MRILRHSVHLFDSRAYHMCLVVFLKHGGIVQLLQMQWSEKNTSENMTDLFH